MATVGTQIGASVTQEPAEIDRLTEMFGSVITRLEASVHQLESLSDRVFGSIPRPETGNKVSEVREGKIGTLHDQASRLQFLMDEMESTVGRLDQLA